jgi:hypothetical protein
MSTSHLLKPDWPCPPGVKACSSTRLGGVSLPPYDSLNLGQHVDDDAHAVAINRQRLQAIAGLPAEPLWLEQVHGTKVVDAKDWQNGCEADAIFSRQPGQVCAIMTADCLPVLFCDREGKQVAATHAGWRGLLNGILQQTVEQFDGPRSDVLAWLGPAIGPQQFEVGSEVYAAFGERYPEAKAAFKRVDETHFLADIYLLARQQLSALGISAVYGGEQCTVTEESLFFSYRRDGVTGRMASLIWIEGK